MLRSRKSGIDLVLQPLVFVYLRLELTSQSIVFLDPVFYLLRGRFEFFLRLFCLAYSVVDPLILRRRDVVRRRINGSRARRMSALGQHQIRPLRLYYSVIPVRFLHAVVAMGEPTDIVNVHFGLGDHSAWIDGLNLIYQAVVGATPVMNYRDSPLALCGDAFGS